MKSTLAALAIAVATFTNPTEASSLRSLGCTNSFVCPTNSYRIPNRNCYNNFDDCQCDKGYYKYNHQCVKDLELTVNNLSFQQPFSSFFVMVHSRQAKPLYEQGEQASHELAILAENGDPNALVHYYQHEVGVFAVYKIDGPLQPGDDKKITVKVNDYYDRVTIASMAINTNDCFVSMNGVQVNEGQILDLPGLDAGSEENNELCTSIPGPACSSNSRNVRSHNGEGFVHVHRGFHGINEGKHLENPLDDGANGKPISAVGYDWRNPLMRVRIH